MKSKKISCNEMPFHLRDKLDTDGKDLADAHG
jgi:hypothetical protein